MQGRFHGERLSISMEFQEILSEGGRIIGQCIATTTSVTSLTMHHNRFGDERHQALYSSGASTLLEIPRFEPLQDWLSGGRGPVGCTCKQQTPRVSGDPVGSGGATCVAVTLNWELEPCGLAQGAAAIGSALQ